MSNISLREPTTSVRTAGEEALFRGGDRFCPDLRLQFLSKEPVRPMLSRGRGPGSCKSLSAHRGRRESRCGSAAGLPQAADLPAAMPSPMASVSCTMSSRRASKRDTAPENEKPRSRRHELRKQRPSITPRPELHFSSRLTQPDAAAELDAGHQEADDKQSGKDEDGHGGQCTHQLIFLVRPAELCREAQMISVRHCHSVLLVCRRSSSRITQAIAVNGNASPGFACDLKGQRDTNNFVCVPATGQVNRL